MKFSFIIPVYNTGNLLKKCVASIASSISSDYEIIIIDDGSTDNSIEIIEGLAEIFPAVRLLRQANSGQGAARNAGVRAACGDYIWFVDSDDWLLDGAVLRVSKVIEANSPDVIVLNYVYAFEDGRCVPTANIAQKLLGKIIKPSTDEHVFASVSCWNTPPWRLVTKRQLLLDNDIVFAEGVFYEDHPFAIHLMFVAERVYIHPPAAYAYFQRSDSTTHANDRKAFDFLKIRQLSIALFKRFDKFDEFGELASTYVSPRNFYDAHVAEPYRQEFVERLGKLVTADDKALLEKVGDPVRIGFIRDAVAGKITKAAKPTVRRIRLLTSSEGRQRLRRGIRYRALSSLRRIFHKTKSFGLKARQAIETGHTHTKNYSLGIGSILEHARVDVRLQSEQRDYLVVGNYSLIGGQYVFERGIGTITIGDYSSVGHGTMMICTQPDGIKIGSQVLISWDVTIIDSNSHPLDPELRANDAFDWLSGVTTGHYGAFKDWHGVTSAPIIIEDRAWIGFGATIMKGVTVGQGAVIAAKSVVTKDVAPFTIVAGNPARFISYVPREAWNWEDTIAAAHGDPAMRDTLLHSYIYKDRARSLKGYRTSLEFREVAKIMTDRHAQPLDILDVGAGNGVCAAAFALEKYNVVAIEPGNGNVGGIEGIELMAADAAKIDPSIYERLHWEQADILKYKTDKRFDAVLCRQALHHFSDPYLAVQNIFSLLKPGGTALFVREHVVFDADDKRVFLENHPFQKFYGGENAYTVDEYVDFITKSGLVIEKIIKFKESPINFEPHPAGLAEELDETLIAGRPYTFIAVRPEHSI
ncbi:Beta-1,3-glucosyltransferase [Ochrobactrum soli]|uniref:Beta-1,3-glucosyltransferase n=1 Tax=Ochrobactrum soli TaxID=2448455 RepID=A0A2P9HKV6_9HYPH|nr:glycosyltransferase [[Ochrobactrum] soli]SPL64774.1 Beta-1,3-glucosyltransferase [[Ochrobactrum] soli]